MDAVLFDMDGVLADSHDVWFYVMNDVAETLGYPAITPELRAKVFGLNALKPYGIDLDEAKLRASNDSVSRRKDNYRNDPDPSFATYGPKTRREFLNLKKWAGDAAV